MKAEGSFPWRGSSSPSVGFRFCGSCGGGPLSGNGGFGGGEPPNGVRFGIGVVAVPNQFHVGRAQVSVLLTEGVDTSFVDCKLSSCSCFVDRVIIGLVISLGSGAAGRAVTSFCS